MKLLRILIVCMMFPWAVWAQQQTEYNRKGDDALKGRIIGMPKCGLKKVFLIVMLIVLTG